MRWGRLAVENHRGVLVPRVLGIVLAIDAVLWTLVSASIADVGAAGWGALVGSLLVFAAGLVDDVARAGPRGLRGHVRALVAGRVTTGIVKLVVIAGSAVVVVALQPDRSGYAAACGVVLLAACANVWNGLDVVPGRSVKAFFLPAIAYLVSGEVANAPLLPGLLVAAVVVLPFDLRELAMLGDGGANLLGFCAGLALYDVLPDGWVPGAAVIAVALNIVAETVSFSRVIERTPLLRWVDALGRRL